MSKRATVRSREEIKKSLIERVKNGESAFTMTGINEEIQKRLDSVAYYTKERVLANIFERASKGEIQLSEKQARFMLKSAEGQPRSVNMLNMIQTLKGAFNKESDVTLYQDRSKDKPKNRPKNGPEDGPDSKPGSSSRP